MAITNRNLKGGEKLVARYTGQEHTVLVLADDKGGLGFELDGATIYKSLSSAGSAVMGGVACNGWRFWSLQGTEPARKPKAEKPAKAQPKKVPAKAAPKAKGKNAAKGKPAKKPKAARMAAKSDSYGCGVCGESFPTQKKAVAHALTHTSA